MQRFLVKPLIDNGTDGVARTVEIMEEYDLSYPGYGFAKHKGYPTQEHYNALQKLGPSPIHRFSFRLEKEKGEQTLSLFKEGAATSSED